MKRVIVCGGRDYDSFEAVYSQLAVLPQGAGIVHGAASGCDALVSKAAHLLGLDVDAYGANGVPMAKLLNPFATRRCWNLELIW